MRKQLVELYRSSRTKSCSIFCKIELWFRSIL